jgi:glyoxylase-like metal-dependent hydrolase (beta-lactamase superfamily II)
MREGFYRFNLGEFDCVALADGYLEQPATVLFPQLSAEETKQILTKYGLSVESTITRLFTCLFIHTEKHRVLIDTGLGKGLLPTGGRLLEHLEEARIFPQEIDAVILTHGHPDHIGGITTREGAVTFPRGRHVMSKSEWTFWTVEIDPQSRPDIDHIQGKLSAIQNRVSLVDRETELYPGIVVSPAPGHTPGHMAVIVSSGEEKLLYLADAIWHPIHMGYPNYLSGRQTEEANITARRLLEWAVQEGALTFGFHFPFPGLGHVVQKGDAWQWQPLDPSPSSLPRALEPP